MLFQECSNGQAAVTSCPEWTALWCRIGQGGLIVETSPQVRPLLAPVGDRLTGCVWASTALARREATVTGKPPSFSWQQGG